MFGQTELETLRLRKELLVLRGDMDRLLLVTELQRAGSAGHWLVEAGKAARRHPLLAAVLGGGVGLLAIRVLRQPGAAVGWLARLGTLGSTALSLWKLFADRKREE
jgi:hypothetical protein